MCQKYTRCSFGVFWLSEQLRSGFCNSGRMMDKPEEFKVNSRNLDLNLDFGFRITANEGKI